MSKEVLLYSLFELIVVLLLIYACTVEEKIINFEQRMKKDFRAIYRACKRQNISFLQFVKVLFSCGSSKIAALLKKCTERGENREKRRCETFTVYFRENA